MDRFGDIADRFGHWVRFVGPRRVVAGTVASVAALVIGLIMLMPAAPPAEIALPMARAGTLPSATAASVPSVVRVHVTGAVRKPGVYVLSPADRVVDAVRAAGGAAANADLESINLAQTILDTEQIFVPRRGTTAPRRTTAPRLRPRRLSTTSVPSTGQNTGPGTASPTTVAARVNVNTATAVQLDSLPGVGPTTARAIISYRQSKGPFLKVDDLLNVPGIGQAKLDAMRGMIET